jgi:nitroreductase
MDFRHACKIFDENKKISSEDIREILEAGRKSPSSFGMEPWKFLVIMNEDLKAKLRPFCWDQVQITSCSHLVVILAAIEGVKPESNRPLEMLSRRGMSEEKLDFYINLYKSHLQKTLESDESIYEWTSRQAYIASANMMTCAAALGIDSCAIEGFEKERGEEILGVDLSKYRLSLILPFGYRVKDQPKQLRLSSDEVVEFIN